MTQSWEDRQQTEQLAMDEQVTSARPADGLRRSWTVTGFGPGRTPGTESETEILLCPSCRHAINLHKGWGACGFTLPLGYLCTCSMTPNDVASILLTKAAS